MRFWVLLVVWVGGGWVFRCRGIIAVLFGVLLLGLGLCLGTWMEGGLLGRGDVEYGAIVMEFG